MSLENEDGLTIICQKIVLIRYNKDKENTNAGESIEDYA